MTNQVHIKNDVLLAHHFFIYNTYFPYHIWIVVGYNNNLVQASHSFLSKTVFTPFFLLLLQLHLILKYELNE